MKILAIPFALALFIPAALGAQTPSLDGAHLYSPATNLEQSELTMLRTAKRSVDIAMYSFTDREIAEELVELARVGVKVRVYRDRTEYQHEAERSDLNTTAMLTGAGIEVRIKGQKDLMHLKSYAIDGTCVRTGSANWSPTGLKRQDNDVRYECSPAAAEQFARKFEELWRRPSNLSVSGQR